LTSDTVPVNVDAVLFWMVCDPEKAALEVLLFPPSPPHMTQPTYASSTPAPVETASIWEDFIDIFASPAKVFRRREHGSWFIPLLVVTVAFAALAIASRGIMQGAVDAEIDKALQAMRQNPQMTEDMIERMRGVMGMTFTIVPIVIMPIIIIVVGFMTWLVGKLFDSRQDLHAALVVAAYSEFPRVIAGLLGMVQGLLLKPEQLNSLAKFSFSPARFIDPSKVSPAMFQLLLRFDLFTIWVTVLLATGLYVTGRVSKQKAAMAGVLFFIIGAIPQVLQGLRAPR
jgi:hypothetical protein